MYIWPGKELTWFTKGLRPTCIRRSKWLVLPRWRNWPDLRRDYDEHTLEALDNFKKKELTWFTKGLRREPALNANYMADSLAKELTWFTKGLRRVVKIGQFISMFREKELTWFTKGLRPIYSELRHSDLAMTEGTDLIYEGITTGAL
jgi:hypothetical protein